eukprot:symbB.v1.2.023241.t1/scaffold2077.1/size90278/1
MTSRGSSFPVTTLALRGICKSYTLERIFQLLNAACESMPRYNFVHFPKKGGHHHGGLAIVNFTDEQSCRRCLECLLKMREDGMFSGVKSIGQSYVQGFAENLAYYVENGRYVENISPVIHQCVTPELMTRAREQAKALYSVGASQTIRDEERDTTLRSLRQLGGRDPTLLEQEQIAMLFPGQTSGAADFLIFSL